MKFYNLPAKAEAFIFDIDATLYKNADYAFEQVDAQVREFARIRGMSAQEARDLLQKKREEWAASHNGEKISLANTMLSFGISIEQSIKWRRELIFPENYLSPDLRLKQVLEALSKKYRLITVTNNPVSTGRRTLDALGLSDVLDQLIGLDTCGVSKPAAEPFQLAVKQLKAKPENCISVGDRYDIDLAYPLSIGMGAILVENGPEDICSFSSQFLE